MMQRIYVQSPKRKGETYNGIAYASYYTATKSWPSSSCWPTS